MIRVAAIQLESGSELQDNLKLCGDLIREASANGAHFIATPENTDSILAPEEKERRIAPREAEHSGIAYFSALAQELKIWLLIGSMSVTDNADKPYNRSVLFNPRGRINARYDKIHLFDVDLPTGEQHRESARCMGGDRCVVVQTRQFTLGMSICYDLRFAYLFRRQAQAGAQILAVPSAFTVPTGKAHWHTLLRARAIETGSFVIAPAQGGTHAGGRKTFGHSLIVGPWGDIRAEAPAQGPHVLLADLDLSEVAKARNAIPALQHDKTFTMDIIDAHEKDRS
ncbi:MAG: carbon-nitrogen hydrolase family protein [Alphaproteobacteria bacterium]|nr:carbon-nitrogen hydrolase family protein [Alphaproteobacteria bacterium]